MGPPAVATWSVRYQLEAAQADVLVELGRRYQDGRGLVVWITSVLVHVGPVCALDVLRRAITEFVAYLELGADRPPGLLINVIGSAGVRWPRVRLGSYRNGRNRFAFGRSTRTRRGRDCDKRSCQQRDDCFHWFITVPFDVSSRVSVDSSASRDRRSTQQ